MGITFIGMMLNKKIILIGGSGHALSVMNLLLRKNLKKYIIGYVDNKKTNLPLKYLGNDKNFLRKAKPKKEIFLVNCIGSNIFYHKVHDKHFYG